MTPPGLRYRIDVHLDTERHRLDGWAAIAYRSGADSSLPAIHLHAYPNAFSSPKTIYARDVARQAEDYSMHFWRAEDRGWMTIDSVSADGEAARVTVDETLARVDLPHPLAPGDSVALRLHFTVQIPKQYDRLGWRGNAFSISQWYPKVTVYDEKGWHPDPFHSLAEFYGDFGTFDVAITLPDRFWVGGTGVLARAEGGDNEIPVSTVGPARDSVTVTLGVTMADSLAKRWPRMGLTAETDFVAPGRSEAIAITVPWDSRPSFRVARGVPVHYSYRWDDGGGNTRYEADGEGRAGPVRLLIAARDTLVQDTLRALAPAPDEGDSTGLSEKTLHFHADRVHDFAWVACSDYVRSDTTWSGIAVRALVYREDQERWRELKTFTVDALRHHSTLVGPYVWPQFTSAEAWCGGSAMEYPMLVMTEPELYSKWAQVLDVTNAHETGHNWFYGMLANDERTDAWLDEGFTQYLEDRYVDTKYPLGLFRYAARFPWLGRASSSDSDEQDYLAAGWARDEQPIVTPSERHPGIQSYGVSAYSKPACMLRTLRGVVGDSLFDAFLHEYYRRYLFRHPRPADVVRTAEDVTRRDLDAFFQTWTETVDRPSFALGKIRKEREGSGYRTSVTVRRKDAMVLPVTVEARFEDGTRQEKQVLAREKDTEAIFESASPLRGAALDPRHELIEMDRLDNRPGLLPPMRFHFLTGFPSSEAIGVAFGPTIWHGDEEGMRLGGWIDGRYLPSQSFPFGIRGFEGGLSYGTQDGSVALRAGAWRRWGMLGARSRVRALAVRDAGLFRAGLSAENVATATSQLHPYRSWSASVEYRDRYDAAPVDPAYWSEGRTMNAALALGLETIGPRRLERFQLAYRHGASAFREDGDPSPDANYDWIQASARQDLDPLPGGFRVLWRVAAGSVFGRVPREQLFDVAERSRLDALPLFYANDRGPLRETDHFHVPGGGGLRGYAGRAIVGQSLLAATVELQSAAHPVYLFGDAGRVEAAGWGEDLEAGLHPLVGRSLADAGVGLRLGAVEFAFPIWVGGPDPGENPWDFRWIFSIGEINLPSR